MVYLMKTSACKKYLSNRPLEFGQWILIFLSVCFFPVSLDEYKTRNWVTGSTGSFA